MAGQGARVRAATYCAVDCRSFIDVIELPMWYHTWCGKAANSLAPNEPFG